MHFIVLQVYDDINSLLALRMKYYYSTECCSGYGRYRGWMGNCYGKYVTVFIKIDFHENTKKKLSANNTSHNYNESYNFVCFHL